MKKASCLLLCLLALSNTCLMGQDLCSILDSAYIEFDQHQYPETKLLFIKNWALYKEGGYAIEQNRESSEFRYVENDIVWDGSKFLEQDWHMPEFAPKIELIDTPSVFFSGDTIYVQNRSLAVSGQYFCWCPSFISLFVYDRNNGVWEHKKGFSPFLDFKFSGSLEDVIAEGIKKVINVIELNQDKKQSFFIISDYLQNHNFHEKICGYETLPHGFFTKENRDKADYFIGYPQFFLNRKEITITFRVIKSKDMKKRNFLKKSQVVTYTFNLDDFYKDPFS